MANVTKPIILDDTGKRIAQGIEDLAKKLNPTAEDIPTSAIPGEDNVEDALKALDHKIDEAEAGNVKTVNAILPDENGEVKITKVAYADNLTSDKTQNSEGEFVIRTAGGDASISDGDAFVMRVYGNRVHEGYTPESLTMAITMTPRVAPDPITAQLDAATFEAYVGEAGVYTLSYTNAWDKNPTLYGVTVTGTPLSGDQITISWDGSSEPYMDVIAPRVAPDPIAATINRDTFVSYVADSGVITLSYTTMWDKNPALYGVTVTGTPINGDVITITYYKEQRGIIKVANPTAMKSTGWNLYNHTAGYAYLTKYSTQYGFLIGGAYSALQYSQTIDGAKSTITPVDGVFTIPADGYVWVTGGNDTTTFIINQWSDWTDGPAGDFEAYSETTIDLSGVMTSHFPYGLCRVGVVRDEININASMAISKIDRMAYNAENLAAAKASGRAYEYDTNYIYIVKASYDSYAITVDGEYTASDHGNEFFVGNDVPTYLETMYGNNLKNKLERDVVTISQQTLTNAQKNQVRSNLSAASQDDIDTLNGRLADGVRLSDCNDATDNTISYYADGNTTNKPTGITSWLLIRVIGKAGGYVTQIASEENVLNGRMWYRQKTSTTWGSWHEIAQKEKTIPLVNGAYGAEGTSDSSNQWGISFYNSNDVRYFLRAKANETVALEKQENGAWSTVYALAKNSMLGDGVFRFCIDTGNKTTFTFSDLPNITTNRYKYFLLSYGDPTGGGAYNLAIGGITTQGSITMKYIIQDYPSITITPSITDSVLKFESSSILYGGVRLIWLA